LRGRGWIQGWKIAEYCGWWIPTPTQTHLLLQANQESKRRPALQGRTGLHLKPHVLPDHQNTLSKPGYSQTQMPFPFPVPLPHRPIDKAGSATQRNFPAYAHKRQERGSGGRHQVSILARQPAFIFRGNKARVRLVRRGVLPAKPPAAGGNVISNRAKGPGAM
jgi:hypothetical protein